MCCHKPFVCILRGLPFLRPSTPIIILPNRSFASSFRKESCAGFPWVVFLYNLIQLGAGWLAGGESEATAKNNCRDMEWLYVSLIEYKYVCTMIADRCGNIVNRQRVQSESTSTGWSIPSIVQDGVPSLIQPSAKYQTNFIVQSHCGKNIYLCIICHCYNLGYNIKM